LDGDEIIYVRKPFSDWLPWDERKKISGGSYPGIYVVAFSERNISGKAFIWQKAIIYVGMTNAASGLIGRLSHFNDTISGKRLRHGGADRVRFKHRNYNKLSKKLFVSVASFKCDISSKLPSDLKKMGKVAEFEYLCFAQYAEKFGNLPQFNNMKISPKFSLKVKKP